ncbi:MAG: beta-ketoacyl-[acyl-carrier-protein] synthase family protein [Gammaproteobacteria bacterium]|nr:beta-ketoacyl-[acyl-carrier-protein] synthase family protein [Gammaproteobacteria bacterium]
MTSARCYLNSLGMLCSAGNSNEEIRQSLNSGIARLTTSDSYTEGTPLPLGACRGELPAIPLADSQWHSRNNQLVLAALDQIRGEVDRAVDAYGADRVGVIIGTSTSGIAESEVAIRQWLQTGTAPESYHYGVQEMGAPAEFITRLLGLSGPCYGISTACSSGAKALASARRLISAGICDAVVAGGVDSLCRLTVQGFSSLEAVSANRSNPMSRNRDGINIGEGAALFLVSAKKAGVELLGIGEGSDAYHISAPEPSGAGAVQVMQAALQDAGVAAGEVDYVNMHGTATVLNDQMESRAIEQVFGLDVACSSTKPFTGHTLGAAGAIEAGICWLTLEASERSFLPMHLWDGEKDHELPDIRLLGRDHRPASPPRRVLSNNFAFGGNNIALLLGRIE